MEITTAIVTGNESEAAVLMSSFTQELEITFKFTLDNSNPKAKHSRIVACFQDIDVSNTEEESFTNRTDMREAIQNLVHTVWQQCSQEPIIRDPDIVVEIQECDGQITWNISHETSYKDYLESLKTLETLSASSGLDSKDYSISFMRSLRPVDVLGGRGDVTLVRVVDVAPSALTKELYVYKGLTFRSFLELGCEYENKRDVLFHELDVISKPPKHPNIIPFPTALIEAEAASYDPTGNGPPSDRSQLICGAIWPFMEKKSLQEVLDRDTEEGEKQALPSLYKWAYEI